MTEAGRFSCMQKISALPGRFLLCLACLLCSAALAPVQALELLDERGVRVSFVQSPQRIVSLLPSLTESICALDQCHRLVGVESYANYPASVLTLPRVGSGLEPNIEAIVALKPDVVILATSSRASQRLESLGLKVVALEPKNHADVQRVLNTLGVLLAIEPEQGAKRLWRLIDSGISAAAKSLPPRAKGRRVYFEISRGPYAAGAASFTGETLTRLGVQNIIPAELGPFPLINPEFVVRANPELIMVGSRNAQALQAYPGWGSIQAIREQRVCIFTPEESDVLARPGPRMAEAARIMAQCIADKSP